MTLVQALILGLLQGVTELFPISSLGHSVILPALLHWPLDEHDPSFLVFLVATHLATALVLLIFFWRDWVAIALALLRSLRTRRIDDAHAKIGWLLIVATIPAGILGLLFEKKLQNLFATPKIAALFLIGNAVLLYGAEFLRKRAQEREIASLSFARSVFVGFMQSLALLPGFSRTGATLGGGLFSGLSHEAAARFAFLLATPIIFAAAAKKLPELVSYARPELASIALGSAAAAVGAYFSVRFLTRYFKTHTLTPFAIYCAALGLVSVLLLW